MKWPTTLIVSAMPTAKRKKVLLTPLSNGQTPAREKRRADLLRLTDYKNSLK
jgi:hypothetical protein